MKLSFSLKSLSKTKPKKSAVGIYIGPESVEIAYLKHAIKGISIIKTAYKEVQRKFITPDTIKEIFQKEDIKETAVTTTIPEEFIMLRRFTMPIIPPKDRPTAVKFEAKRHIPFNIDEVISNFQVINENPAKNQMEVLFAAVKKEEINSIIYLLQGAGLTIEKIEPISLALIKTLILTGHLQETSPPAIILHFSTKTDAQIIIAENGIPYLKREISLLGKDVKAEEQILNEIRLSSSYYKREFPERNINKIIICGLTGSPPWLNELKSSLDMTIEQVYPLKEIAGIDIPNPQLEIPLGLASLALESPAVELNLLPEELIPAKFDFAKILAVESATAICIVGLIYLFQFPSLIGLKKDISSAESAKTAYAGMDISSKPIDELNSLIGSLQQKKSILTSCTQNRINWHEKLKLLVQLMPKDIWISQLNITDSIGGTGARRFSFQGSTYNPEPIDEIEITNNFSKSLKENQNFMKGFTGLTLGPINKIVTENHEVANFDITASSG